MQIAILLYDGVVALDAVGPYDVLKLMPEADVRLVAATAGQVRTDGPLSLDKYATYEDDKQLFPPYYITFMVSEKGMKALGQSGQDVIQKVQEPLTEKVMAELNSRVSIDKKKPEDVAADYLKAAGFVQ